MSLEIHSKKRNSPFVDGPIKADFIAQSILKHQSKTNIGTHQIFLGQVRADNINEKKVKAIHYSAYEEVAIKELAVIREEAFKKFDLVCLHIYHSLSEVRAGDICMFVFVSSQHREESSKAIHYLVEEIKKRIPVFGKEIFEDNTHQWKTNI